MLTMFLQICLKLQALPAHKTLGVCHFPSFYEAMEATQHIVELNPSAVELVDRTMIYQSNNLFTATDGDTEKSWYVQAGTKEAATFASQVDKVDTLKIPDSFGEYWRTLFVYGRAVVQPTCLINAIVTV